MDRTADVLAGDDKLYAIKPILGKGQGFIATSKISKGTRILLEAPVFKMLGSVGGCWLRQEHRLARSEEPYKRPAASLSCAAERQRTQVQCSAWHRL
jgi:hypothetical protein